MLDALTRSSAAYPLSQMASVRHAPEDANAGSDEALFLRVVASGDASAFTLLVARYRRPVLALAARMLGYRRRDEAEDVAQETFVAVFERRSQFHAGRAFRPWLYRIAVNRCLDRLRRERSEPVSAPESEPLSRDHDPLDKLFAADCSARLSAAVAELDPRLRAVFLLHYVEGMSYEEMSLVVGRPMGTVKTHLFRARERLRQALREYVEP